MKRGLFYVEKQQYVGCKKKKKRKKHGVPWTGRGWDAKVVCVSWRSIKVKEPACVLVQGPRRQEEESKKGPRVVYTECITSPNRYKYVKDSPSFSSSLFIPISSLSLSFMDRIINIKNYFWTSYLFLCLSWELSPGLVDILPCCLKSKEKKNQPPILLLRYRASASTYLAYQLASPFSLYPNPLYPSLLCHLLTLL